MQVDKPKGVFGTVKSLKLGQFRPNDWNPNRMTPFTFESLREDMRVNGWPASQALLVWGKDEKGVERNVIIDGEHRQKAALEIGYTSGPVVVVDGLTELQAKEWTIKLDNKRGTFDQESLATLIRELDSSNEGYDLSLMLGFRDEELVKLLAVSEEVIRGSEPPASSEEVANPIIHSENPHVKMVPLYFDAAQYAEFEAAVRRLGTKFGTETVTDTILATVRSLNVERSG